MPIRSIYIAKKNEKRSTSENTVIHVISCMCVFLPLPPLRSIELIGSAHTLAWKLTFVPHESVKRSTAICLSREGNTLLWKQGDTYALEHSIATKQYENVLTAKGFICLPGWMERETQVSVTHSMEGGGRREREEREILVKSVWWEWRTEVTVSISASSGSMSVSSSITHPAAEFPASSRHQQRNVG